MSSKQQLQSYTKRLKVALQEKDTHIHKLTNEVLDLRMENEKLKYEALKKSSIISRTWKQFKSWL